MFASSSSIYGDAERYPTPEDAEPRPISPYGITKLGCEQLAHAYAQGFGLDAVVLRYFTFYGPRQRPDMAFARISTRSPDGATFELYGDGLQSRAFTYVADGVTRRSRRWTGPRGALQRRRRRRGDDAGRDRDLERVSGRTLDLVERPAAAGDVRRTAADTTRIERDLGWRAPPRWKAACRPSGNGPPLESPRIEHPGHRPRRRAGSRPRPLLARDRRALVAPACRSASSAR